MSMGAQMFDELKNKRVFAVSVNGTRFHGIYTGRKDGSCVELVNAADCRTGTRYACLIINISTMWNFDND